MKKPIITIIILVIIAVVVYAIAKRSPTTPPLPEETTQNPATSTPTANEGEVSGVVTSVDTSQVPVDGPATVNIRQDNGTESVIAVASMGINLCAARDNIADVYALKAGDHVEVRGHVGEGGVIFPCESAEHYLRVVVE